jgi:hypothetical protein
MKTMQRGGCFDRENNILELMVVFVNLEVVSYDFICT